MPDLYKKAYIVWGIVCACAVVYIGEAMTGGADGMNLVTVWGAYFAPYVLSGAWYRLLTAGFIHFGFEHLCGNCFSLVAVGPYVERRLGHAKCLIVALVSLLCGNLLTLGIDLFGGGSSFAFSAGASGMVAGLIGAFIAISVFRKTGGRLPTRNLVIAALLVIFPGFTASGMNINIWAHIGGLAGGGLTALVFLFLRARKP